jgi:hypothetical protein
MIKEVTLLLVLIESNEVQFISLLSTAWYLDVLKEQDVKSK